MVVLGIYQMLEPNQKDDYCQLTVFGFLLNSHLKGDIQVGLKFQGY